MSLLVWPIILKTEELLLVNDELNNVFLRHDRYRRMTSGQGQTRVSDEVRDVVSVMTMVMVIVYWQQFYDIHWWL